MTDETTIEPITASADGKRNAYTHACRVVQQKMNYAACLHRQEVIAAGVDVPRDWLGCDTPMCLVRGMRQEELIAGKAIYFTPRTVLGAVADGARQWVMNVGKTVKKAVGLSASAASPQSKSANAMDAMGDLGSFADAVNVMPKTVTVTKPLQAPPRVLSGVTEGVHPSSGTNYVRKTMAVALPGETPLQMALRLKAERVKA